jgi:arylsulfatase A-like enzyme
VDIPVPEEQYASMVEGMDASLGSLLDHLESLGVAENTLVIFTSDNGGLSAVARDTTPYGTGLNSHNWPLRAGKGSAYDGGTRVPYIVSWARASSDSACQKELPIVPGSQSDQPIMAEDIFPTLLAVANATPEIPVNYPLDGRDIRSHILGKESDPLRAICFHYPHVWGPHGPGYEPHSSLHVGVWKVIYFYIPKRWELYNTAEDVGEMSDVAGEYPDGLQEMARRMITVLNEKGVQWPTRRDTGEDETPVLPS